jgi:hypothetical protein
VSASATETAAAVVMLKGGLVVPLEVLKLAWSLEDRGAIFLLDGPELVIDAPTGAITEADAAATRRWRMHLIEIVGYQPPMSGYPS